MKACLNRLSIVLILFGVIGLVWRLVVLVGVERT